MGAGQIGVFVRLALCCSVSCCTCFDHCAADIKAICNAQDPLKKAANALCGSEKMLLSIDIGIGNDKQCRVALLVIVIMTAVALVAVINDRINLLEAKN